MFDNEETQKRIGDRVKKSTYLNSLKEVELYFRNSVEKIGLDSTYDVTAIENPYFKTFGYTEWGTSFIAYPLNNDLREQQIFDSLVVPNEKTNDWSSYLNKVLKSKSPNKYIDRKEPTKEKRENIVVLLGSNKLNEVICINKCIELSKKYDGNIWFKPHPLTTHELVGFIKDRVGENNVLDRDDDLYYYLKNSKKVFGTCYTESILYASVLGLDREPIDRYNRRSRAGFYHINKILFNIPSKIAGDSINKILSNPRSGVFNPRVDNDWKLKIDQYLEYMASIRNNYENWYWEPKKENKKE